MAWVWMLQLRQNIFKCHRVYSTITLARSTSVYNFDTSAVSRLYRTLYNTSSYCYLFKCSCNTFSVYSKHSQYRSSSGSEVVGDSSEVDKEREKKLALVKMEIELHRAEGSVYLPSNITPEQWEELIALDSYFQRKSYLVFLFKNEMKEKNQLLRKEKVREIRREKHEMVTEELKNPNAHIKYGLWHNSMFLRVGKSNVESFFDANLINAMMFSQHLLIDCSYDDYMYPKEQNECIKQLMCLVSENHFHKEPFHLRFVNLQPESKLRHTLTKRLCQREGELGFPVFATTEHYLNLYPKEKLIYLSPDASEEITKFNHDAVYIIGGIVDKRVQKPLSRTKAVKEGLKIQKFPLDKHLIWIQGMKSLPLNQVVSILLDLRYTGDWDYAFRHIPKRKARTMKQKNLLKNF